MPDSEHDIQARLVARCRLAKYPVLAIPNGAKFGRNAKLAAIQMHRLKAEGLEPGVPDLHFPTAAHGHHGLWLETKSAKGVLSEDQALWLYRLRGLGHLAYWYRDDEAAFEFVKLYHSPPTGDLFTDALMLKGKEAK